MEKNIKTLTKNGWCFFGFQVKAEAEKLQPKEAAEVRERKTGWGGVGWNAGWICRVSDGPRERWKWPNPWSANWWRKLRQSRCSAVLLYSSNPQWPFSTWKKAGICWNKAKRWSFVAFGWVKSQCFWNRNWMGRVEDSKGKREVLDKVARSLSSAHPSGQRVLKNSGGECWRLWRPGNFITEIARKLDKRSNRHSSGILWGSLSYQ